MNPATARLIEAALGGGLGAALGAGVGSVTGTEEYPNTIPLAAVGGLAGALGAPAASLAAAARRAGPIRAEAQQMADQMAYKAHRMHSDAVREEARRLATEARQRGEVPNMEQLGRQATQASEGLAQTLREAREAIHGGAEDAIRNRLHGRVFGGLRKTSASAAGGASIGEPPEEPPKKALRRAGAGVAGLAGWLALRPGGPVGNQITGRLVDAHEYSPTTLQPGLLRELRQRAGNPTIRMVDPGEGPSAFVPRGGVLPGGAESVGLKGTPRGKEVYRSLMERGGVMLERARGAEVAAHELGHLLNRAGPVSGLLSRGRVPGFMLMSGGGLAGLAGEKDSPVEKVAPVAVALGGGLVLGEEGLASRRGMRLLEETGRLSPEHLQAARRNLLRSLGTYAVVPAAALTGLGVAHALKGRPEADEEKTSAYSNAQILSPLAPRDVHSREPVGPLTGTLAGGGAWLGATYGGARAGQEVGSRWAQGMEQAAHEASQGLGSLPPNKARQTLEHSDQLRAAAKAMRRQAPRAGMYGGALLGVPLAWQVGRWVSGSPRWGIMNLGRGQQR